MKTFEGVKCSSFNKDTASPQWSSYAWKWEVYWQQFLGENRRSDTNRGMYFSRRRYHLPRSPRVQTGTRAVSEVIILQQATKFSHYVLNWPLQTLAQLLLPYVNIFLRSLVFSFWAERRRQKRPPVVISGEIKRTYVKLSVTHEFFIPFNVIALLKPVIYLPAVYRVSYWKLL